MGGFAECLLGPKSLSKKGIVFMKKNHVTLCAHNDESMEQHNCRMEEWEGVQAEMEQHGPD